MISVWIRGKEINPFFHQILINRMIIFSNKLRFKKNASKDKDNFSIGIWMVFFFLCIKLLWSIQEVKVKMSSKWFLNTFFDGCQIILFLVPYHHVGFLSRWNGNRIIIIWTYSSLETVQKSSPYVRKTDCSYLCDSRRDVVEQICMKSRIK